MQRGGGVGYDAVRELESLQFDTPIRCKGMSVMYGVRETCHPLAVGKVSQQGC